MGERGYVGLDRWSLIEDVLKDEKTWDAAAIVKSVLPRLCKAPGHVPVFKYLRAIDAITVKGQVKKGVEVADQVRRQAERNAAGLPAGRQYADAASRKLAGISTVPELEAAQGTRGVMNYAVHLPRTDLRAAEVKAFLELHPELRHGSPWEQTGYARLACFYDWLHFGLGED